MHFVRKVFASRGRKRWILSSRGEPELVCMHLFRGGLHSCFGRSLCRLNLLCTLLFCRWCRVLLPHLEELAFWSTLSQLCWVDALTLGDQDLLFQVILFWLLFGFGSFAWVLCSFLLFFFILWIGDYVCCQCTHQRGDWGPEHPRASGWSLPGVKSDWQCGVDWLFAKYCRCRLWLDLRWCRWRMGAKGLSLAGPPRSGETSRLGLMDPVAERDQVRAA
jgi:hypothetical protein